MVKLTYKSSFVLMLKSTNMHFEILTIDYLFFGYKNYMKRHWRNEEQLKFKSDYINRILVKYFCFHAIKKN